MTSFAADSSRGCLATEGLQVSASPAGICAMRAELRGRGAGLFRYQRSGSRAFSLAVPGASEHRLVLRSLVD